jgi:dynactin complex subunit
LLLGTVVTKSPPQPHFSPIEILTVLFSKRYEYFLIFSNLRLLLPSVTKLYRQQATVIQNHENVTFATLAKARLNTKYKRLKLDGGQAYNRSVV